MTSRVKGQTVDKGRTRRTRKKLWHRSILDSRRGRCNVPIVLVTKSVVICKHKRNSVCKELMSQIKRQCSKAKETNVSYLCGGIQSRTLYGLRSSCVSWNSSFCGRPPWSSYVVELWMDFKIKVCRDNVFLTRWLLLEGSVVVANVVDAAAEAAVNLSVFWSSESTVIDSSNTSVRIGSNGKSMRVRLLCKKDINRLYVTYHNPPIAAS